MGLHSARSEIVNMMRFHLLHMLFSGDGQAMYSERERAMQCNDVAPVLRCTQRDDAINVCNGMDDDDVATRNIERSSDLSTGNVVAM